MRILFSLPCAVLLFYGCSDDVATVDDLGSNEDTLSSPHDAGTATDGNWPSAETTLDDRGAPVDTADDAAGCKANENLCNGKCVPNSIQSCGPSCTACPTTANGAPTCTNGVCGFQCDLGYAECVSGCCAQQAKAVTAGSSHTCAITTGGGAMCWGYNVDGELGNGNRIGQKVPVDVKGLTAGVAQISASTTTTCAVTTSGLTKCWGGNAFLQLGPTVQPFWFSDTPVDITLGAGTKASAVATGQTNTCAVITGGGAKCWGDNGTGQLGDGSNTDSTSPVDVKGLSGVAEITVGYGHTCARATGGGAKCWGKGSVSELGNSNKFHSSVPVDVTGLSSGVLAISTFKRHTCALVSGGTVKCWGENDTAQLGSNTSATDSSVPVTIAGLPAAATAVSAGAQHVCAIVTGGAVYCWGSNLHGRLGGGPSLTKTESATPVAVTGLASGVVAISCGGGHSCAVLASGSMKCWGQNDVGQLGNNSTGGYSSTPVTVVAFP